PHVRRLRRPVDQDPFFWEVAMAPFMTNIAADLVGPDVKFHSCKLNYKWPGAGEVVKWHQDILSWPHTNYSPVTLGIYLDDVGDEEGPLACVEGSHEGPLFSQYDESGKWSGHISDEAAENAGATKAVDLKGPAGSIIAINCRTIHGSQSNRTRKVRPLLLYVYSSADAFPWMPAPTPTSKTGDIVRGATATLAHLDPRPCPVPPDWSKEGYGSIFTVQSQT
ncbi:MAG: phytanoyl-CoA dioxygenase family protein, partial [Alphaproteobacteria bacterium]